MYPEDLRYNKEHEWVRVEGDIGTIGITGVQFHAGWHYQSFGKQILVSFHLFRSGRP